MPEKEKKGPKKRRSRSLEERYPNLNFHPPREGRSLIIFKGPSKQTSAKPSRHKES
jgi:hypothetical protein